MGKMNQWYNRSYSVSFAKWGGAEREGEKAQWGHGGGVVKILKGVGMQKQ